MTDPDNTDCCTYVSGAGTPNLVNPVQQPTGPTATLSTKDTVPSMPDMGMRTDTSMKDRMQKLANIKPNRK